MHVNVPGPEPNKKVKILTKFIITFVTSFEWIRISSPAPYIEAHRGK